MTNKEAKEKLYMEWQKFLEDNIDYAGISEAYKMAFKSLEQEPCDDAISRQATIEAFQMFRGYEANRTNAEWVDRIETVVKKLPPVKPKQRMGHWIVHEIENTLKWLECSNCHCETSYKVMYNYCPNCGCAMKGELE